MAICIFPGTFNPIHLAHLRMAQIVVQKFGFEKVIFIPSYIPPHKQVDSNLARHRFNMVKMAIEKNLRFGISDIEYKSEGKSYTLITVKKIKKLYGIEGRLNFLIGTDAFLNVKSWYKAEELKDLVARAASPKANPDNVTIAFSDSLDPFMASDKNVKSPIKASHGNPWWLAIVLLFFGLLFGHN